MHVLDQVELHRLPKEPGIYVVYIYRFLIPDKIIYIGKADDLYGRLTNRDEWDEWREKLTNGEELGFHIALTPPTVDLERAEAAMIKKHDPVYNEQSTKGFNHPTTRIVTSGHNDKMCESFTVERS